MTDDNNESQFLPAPIKVEGQPIFGFGEISDDPDSKPPVPYRLIERKVPLMHEDDIHQMITDLIISKGYDIEDFKTWSVW
jgi:hypothetical protein